MRTWAWRSASAVVAGWLMAGIAVGDARSANNQSSTTTSSTSKLSTPSSTTSASSTGQKTSLAPKITVIKSTLAPTGSSASTTPTTSETSLSMSRPASPQARPPVAPKPTPTSPPRATRALAPAKPKAPPPMKPPSTATATTAGPPRVPVEEGIISIDGSITALDVAAASPSFQIRTANGKTWTLAAEPSTSVLKHEKSATLADLAVGDTVRVSFAMKNGRHVARSLEVTNNSAAPNASIGSSTAEPMDAAQTP